MSRRAILRWQQAGSWGHLGLRTETGEIRFAGFVPMSDRLVLELLATHEPSSTEGDMREVHFTIPEPAYALT
ncbi:hypothetical protein GCM10010470_63370 [Saccharopolyspora taberi]|uniref:Uncharacterized protein n=1 Tax=Saccharopolyspora taberi TaxID=60895 RepID=A0ABN3VMB8_9PSEU